jgi:hypothetical protein
MSSAIVSLPFAAPGIAYSHSIVQQTRKGLFSFEKPVQPPRFSRQPYRQTFGLLISLENFERWKISPIAVYRN